MTCCSRRSAGRHCRKELGSTLLDGGGALPFGGYKAGALTDACFGYEGGRIPWAQASKAGQTVILIDPMRVPGNRYFERRENLFTAVAESGGDAFQPTGRYRCCEVALREGH